MKIAVEGCAHGELEKIYETLELIENRENFKVDLLICCGDFQAVRNANDLNCMAVPKKFQDICTFYKYYSGEKVAPILTIFIGGNHEASNYLQELPYGGWVAPNIYYMGYAGVINVNGIRISGISGIYKGFDYFKGHFEFSPYNNETKRSVYHVRQLDVYRLKQITPTIDIMISHDWPRGCYNFGNVDQLLRFKPHFRNDVANNKLGSPPLEELLKVNKPKYWFSAHLHCKFSSIIPHGTIEGEDVKEQKVTKFLALDKCLPKRRFLQLLDIDSEPGEITLNYDLEWLTILRTTNHLINAKNTSNYMPGTGGPYRWDFRPTEDELNYTKKMLQDNLKIPLNFSRTVEPYNTSDSLDSKLSSFQPNALINPQTTIFCDLLEIDDPLSLAMIMAGKELNSSSYIDTSSVTESNVSNDDEGDSGTETSFNTSCEMTPAKKKSLMETLPILRLSDATDNPEKLDLSDESDDNTNEHLDINSSTLLSSTNSSSFCYGNNASIIDDCTPDKLTDDNSAKISNSSLKSDESDSPKRISNDDINTSSSSAKKFKRRNEAIYANND